MKLSIALAAAVALVSISCDHALATPADGCAARLDGVGTPARLPTVYSEPQRIAVSTVIFEAMRAPPGGARPEGEIGRRPCPIEPFQVQEDSFTLHGGLAPGPLRWTASEKTALTFYLVAGRQDRAAADLGFKGRPYALAAVVMAGDQRMHHVLRLFDGPPSDRMIEDTIRESLTSSDFVPLADYDREGDAVTLFRGTFSHKGAQLFGPAPTGNRTAAILLPDGEYFHEGNDRDAVMRDVGLACPPELAQLGNRQLVIVEGDPAHQDLACQYASDDVRISIFVQRLPGADLKTFFETQRGEMKSDYKDPADRPLLVGVNGPTRFRHGAAWLGAGGKAGGIWVGRKGDYVIELDATWRVESDKEARAAIRAVDLAAFGS